MSPSSPVGTSSVETALASIQASLESMAVSQAAVAGAEQVAFLDGVVAGTVSASQALVVGASRQIATIGAITGDGAWSTTITAGSATPGTLRALRGEYTTYTSQTSGNLVGVRGAITAGGSVSGTAALYGVQGKFITGANTVAGTIGAVYGQFDMTGGTLGAGNIAVIHANVVGCASGTVALNGMYVENAGGGAINSYGRFLGNSTFVFDIESSFTNQSTTGTAGATSAKGWLKVQITNGGGTVTRYIPLTDSVS